jgi:hypothetical protein
MSDALAISVETKVRFLHSEWTEEQIQEEVEKIKEENGLTKVENPDTVGMINLDMPMKEGGINGDNTTENGSGDTGDILPSGEGTTD